MKRSISICVAIWLSGFVGAANASTITINANEFSPGTNLSALFPGLTLSHLRNEPNHDGFEGREVYRPIASPVYATPTYHAPDDLSIGGFGIEVYAYDGCRGSGAYGVISTSCSDYDVLNLSFDGPTSFIEIHSVAFSDSPDIFAYDLSGNRISFQPGDYNATYTPFQGNELSTITVRRAQSDIAQVVYGGLAGNSTPLKITYKVPEPSSMGLIMLGLMGAATLRRRRSGF